MCSIYKLEKDSDVHVIEMYTSVNYGSRFANLLWWQIREKVLETWKMTVFSRVFFTKNKDETKNLTQCLNCTFVIVDVFFIGTPFRQ